MSEREGREKERGGERKREGERERDWDELSKPLLIVEY